MERISGPEGCRAAENHLVPDQPGRNQGDKQNSGQDQGGKPRPTYAIVHHGRVQERDQHGAERPDPGGAEANLRAHGASAQAPAYSRALPYSCSSRSLLRLVTRPCQETQSPGRHRSKLQCKRSLYNFTMRLKEESHRALFNVQNCMKIQDLLMSIGTMRKIPLFASKHPH